MPGPDTARGTDLPTSPPTGGGTTTPATGPNSATALRAEAAGVQKQLDALQKTIADRDAAAGPSDPTGPRPTEATMISSLNARLAQLTTAISTAESRAPAVISGGSPSDKHIIRQNPDGTITTSDNPNWDGKSDKPQVVSSGNHIYTVGSDGKVTVAYTDTDAQTLANRQADVAEKNAATAAAAQATNDAATRAKVDLENRVANGEDAASVRAQQAQDLQALHDSWVRADGDARRAQAELTAYNTERHQTAADTLGQQQLQATADWQKQQDATARRGQDLGEQQSQRTAQTAEKATQASLTNARVGAAGGYAGNVMQLLNSLNKDVAPGSSAVGDMLVPMLMLGQEYFKQMAGGGGAASVNDPNAAAAVAPQPVVASTTDQASMPAGADAVTSTAPAPIGSADDWYTQWQARQEADRQAQLAAASSVAPTTVGTGSGRWPGYASGGIVTKPTLAMVGEQGPEAIVPLTGASPMANAPAPDLSGSGSSSTLQAVGAFLTALAGANGSGSSAPPLPMGAGATPPAVGPGDPQAALAAQAAAAMGHPPEVGANPMLPGSAVPGVPPAAAGAAARVAPLGPDGSPYITPADVAARLQARRGGAMPAPAGAGAGG